MNRYINNVIAFVTARPVWLVALLVLVAALSIGGYSSCQSARYDRTDAKHEAEKATLRAERDAALKQANDAEARAVFAEAKNAQTDQLIEASTGKIKEAEAQLEVRIEEAKRGAGSCSGIVDAIAHRSCVCAKLTAAGFPCA